MQLLENYSLKNHNTFRIDAKAKLFASVESEHSLVELLTQTQINKNKVLALGSGSNVLFTADYGGLVIHNSIKGIEKIDEGEDTVKLEVGGGEVWEDLINYALEHNYSGIENLTLIPGRTGAAPIQNIGAYGVELKDTFHSLSAVNINTGQTEVFTKKDCHFGYRYSIFKGELKYKYIITKVRLTLRKYFIPRIDYASLKNALSDKDYNEITMRDVVETVRAIRKSKLPNPEELPNAGSFFKNPEIPNSQLDKIQSKYSEVPGFKIGDDLFKVPAGWMIEKCGLKGKRIGEVGTHKDQALVIVNYGGASGNEILQFARIVQNEVHKKFGIQLEPEVNII